MSEDESVIQLPVPEPREDGPWAPVIVEGDHYARECHHGYTVLADKARELRCRDCGALVDPYVFLRSWANRLKTQKHNQLEMVKGLEQVRVHALGLEDTLTLCGIGTKTGNWDRTFTVRVSTDHKRIDCRRCIDTLKRGAVHGHRGS